MDEQIAPLKKFFFAGIVFTFLNGFNLVKESNFIYLFVNRSKVIGFFETTKL